MIILLITIVVTTLIVGFYFCRPVRALKYKFEISTFLKISIRTHILSGTVTFVTLFLSLFTTSNYYLSIFNYVSIVANIVHCFTSYGQLPSVYGTKLILYPGYFYLITLKLLRGCFLYFNILSYQRYMSLLFTHAAFTWSRFFYILLELFQIGVYKQSLYTTSMVLGSMFTESIASGIDSLFIFWCFVLLFVAWYNVVCKRKGLKVNWLVEHSRISLDLESHSFESLLTLHRGLLAQERNAKCDALFEFVDTNKSGDIDPNELFLFLANVGVTKKAASDMLVDADDGSGTLTKFEFRGLKGLDQILMQLQEDVAYIVRQQKHDNEDSKVDSDTVVDYSSSALENQGLMKTV